MPAFSCIDLIKCSSNKHAIGSLWCMKWDLDVWPFADFAIAAEINRARICLGSSKRAACEAPLFWHWLKIKLWVIYTRIFVNEPASFNHYAMDVSGRTASA